MLDPTARPSFPVPTRCLRAALWLLICCGLAAPASAVSSTHRVLIDSDFNPATGCTVTTADGPFTGVEQILVTTVETDETTGTVTSVERQVCDPGTNTFGPAIFVSNGGWPVGVGIGVDGSDVIEACMPLAALGDPLPSNVIRLAVTSDDGTAQDALLVAAQGTDTPILLDVDTAMTPVTEIPTLSEWALILFALLLMAFALTRMRREHARVAFAIFLLLLAGGTFAVMEDGMIGDWSGQAPIGQDPQGDAPEGVDLRALFGVVMDGEVCFRIDVFLAFESPNGAPDAVDDAFVVLEDSGTTSLPVLTNDTDPDGDPLTITAVGTPDQGGTATINGSNVDYTPAPNFTGVETFTYTITDGTATDTATVTVTVTPVNDAPVALPDSYGTPEDTPLVVLAPGVLGNDTDVDGDMLTAALVTGPVNGMLTLNPDGSFTYTPNADFTGSDSFTYRANDGTADSNVATVTLTVAPVNDGPVAIDDMSSTNEDTLLDVPAPGVLGNDFDTEGDTLTVTAFDATSVQGATVVVDADGGYRYDPTGAPALQALATGEVVNDTFTYTISDGTTTDTATVTVQVTGVDDPPTAVDDAATVAEDAPATTIDVLANDTDPDGGTLTVTGVTQPANGTVVITNGGADLTYRPNANYCNDGAPTDNFMYTVNGGSTATVAVTVTCVNDPPTADDEMITAACNVQAVVETDPGQTAAAAGPVSLSVSDNVLDGDGDPVEMSAISIIQADGATSDNTAPFTITTAQGGTVTLHTDGSFTYTSEAGDAGVVDSFTYTIQDADGGVATATVTVNVGSVCVWFVDNTDPGNTAAPNEDAGTGTSSDPFHSLVDETPDVVAGTPDDAEDASGAGDLVYVFRGASDTDPYLGGYTAQMNERILGEGVDLVVDLGSGPQTLYDSTANQAPVVDNPAGDGFTVSDVTGVEIAGFELTALDNGLQVVSTGTNDVSVDFHDNVISEAGGEGILVEHASTGEAIVALSDNEITATGDGIDLSSALGGTLYVTDFCGLVVDGATGGDGIDISGATFDSNPTDPDFTGDEVTCSGLTIGEPADPVGGSGLVLENVTGDLALGSLDVHAGTAGGLDESAVEVSGDGTFDAGAGTGFQLSTTGGTVRSVDGPALVTETVDLDGMSLTTLVSEASDTNGVMMDETSGTFGVSGATTVTTSAQDNLLIWHSSVTSTYAGVTTLSGAGQSGVELTVVSGDFSITNPGSSISGAAGDAFFANGSSGNITYNGTITNTADNSVVIQSHGGPAATTVLFAGAIDDDGAGIFLNNNDQGVGSLVRFSGGLDLDTGTDEAFVAIEGGTVEVLSGSVSTTADTTTGTAVRIVNSTIGPNGVFFDSTSVSGAADGIRLTNVGSGAFTSNGGSLTNVTNRGVDISGGSGDVSIAASVSTTTAGRSVETTTHNGGTVTYSGAIDDNGLGIRLENNVGATVNFTGGLDIDTAAGVAEEGFQATGGGTVTVQGTGNEVDTSLGTGIAVNIANTTIGAAGVTWENVSAVGGSTPGILLDSTGTSGGFSVTGAGGDCEASTAGCSGGTISGRIGDADGILLTDTQLVSLSHMNVVSNTGNGLVGTRVNGFEIVQSRFSDNSDEVTPDEAGLHFIDSTGTGAAGTHPARFEDVVVEDSHEHDVIIRNATGVLALSVTSSSFLNDGSSGQAGNRFFVDTSGTADVTVDVANSVFRGNRTAGALTAFGFVGDAAGTSDLDLEVTGSDFDLHSVGLSASASGGGDVTFNYATNTIDDTDGNGINFFANASHTGIVSGTVSGNFVGTLNDTSSGSATGSGIRASNEGNGTMTLLVDGNTVQEVANFEGVIVSHALLGTTTGTTNATITNNVIRETDFDRGLVTQIISDGTLCADIRGNTFSNIGGTTDMRVRRTAGTFNVEQDRPTAAVVATELDDANGGATVTVTESGGTINFGAANCPTP